MVSVRHTHPRFGPAAYLLRSEDIFLGIYVLVVGGPYFLLWRSYKKAPLNFVSAQDEVVLSQKPGSHGWPAAVVLFVSLVLLATIVWLERFR
jgi:hypothetical protein